MAVTRGPRIVTDGLVLCLDAADQNSCGGQPITNLLTYTNALNNAVWQGYCGPTSNITFNTTDITDPIGTNTAIKVVRGSNVVCNSTEAWGLLYSPASPIIISGGTYTTSFYARGLSGGETLDYGLNDTNFYFNQSLTTNWTRYSVTWTNITGTDRGFQFRNTTGNCTYYMWGPQTVSGSNAGPYATSVGATNGTANLVWRDMSGGNYNATTYGNIPFSTEDGGCYDFSTVAGSTSQTSTFGFSFVNNMVPTTGNFTISTWIKNPPTNVIQSGLFSNAGSADGYRFGIGKDAIYWLIGPTYAESTVAFLNTLNSTSWYNVTAIFARSEATPQIRVYLNGVFQNSGNFNVSQTAFTNTAPGIIRSPCCMPLFNGKLATFNVYNRALSASEIKQNFDAVKSRFGL